jgi:hypothetical protein
VTVEDTETHTDLDDLVAEMVEAAIDQARKDRVAAYFGNYGDAIQTRLDRLLKTAEDLIAHECFEASVVTAVTAMEVLLRHYLVRPLLKGELGSNFIADELVAEILSRRSSTDRDLLPVLVQGWKIGRWTWRLTDAPGSPELWKTFKEKILPIRNALVHQGTRASIDDAKLALSVPKRFLESVLPQLADQVGLSWSVTRKWSDVSPGVGGGAFDTAYGEESPFRKNGKIDPP